MSSMSDDSKQPLKNPTWEATKATLKEAVTWTLGWAAGETAFRAVLLKAPFAAAAKRVFTVPNLVQDMAIFGAMAAFLTAPKVYKDAVQANALAIKDEKEAVTLPAHADPVMTRSFAAKLEQERSTEQGAAADLSR